MALVAGGEIDAQAEATDPAADAESSPLAILKACDAAMFIECFRDWPPEVPAPDAAPPRRSTDADTALKTEPSPGPTARARRSGASVAPEPGTQPMEPELQKLLQQVEELGLDYELPPRYARP